MSKILAPGLRLGAIISPKIMASRINAAAAANQYMLSPISRILANQLLSSSAADSIITVLRKEASTRTALATAALGVAPPSIPSLHLWIDLKSQEMVDSIMLQASGSGIRIPSPALFWASAPAERKGLRLALGINASEHKIATALATLRLDKPWVRSSTIV